MKEIKCPKCGEVFAVDESGYAQIVQQVRDKEFDKELKQREKDLEEIKDKNIPIRILTGNYLNITQPSALYLLKDILGDKVDLRLGSGIEVLNENEVDEVIIAGMGGILISELLEAKKSVAHNLDKLILQPMQAQDELRKYLLNNGYEILDEVLVKEDFRIYEIIVAKYTSKNTVVDDEIYYEVGKKLIENKDPLLNEFIDKKIFMYNSILKKLEGKTGEEIEKKIKISTEKISKLENLKK